MNGNDIYLEKKVATFNSWVIFSILVKIGNLRESFDQAIATNASWESCISYAFKFNRRI